MENRAAEIRVGVTAILALVILVIGIIWSKEMAFTTSQVSFDIVFPNSSGLDVGDPVKILGVKKGKVKNIQLRDSAVWVTVVVDDAIILYDNASAQIKSQDLMSGKCVELIPGTPGRILDLASLTGPIKGQATLAIEDMSVIIGELYIDAKKILAKIDTTLGAFNNILTDTDLKEKFASILLDLNIASAELRGLLQTNRVLVDKSLANLDTTAVVVRRLIVEREAEIDSSIQRLITVSRELETTTGLAKEMAERISRGEGTVGKLLQDEDTYFRLTRAVANIDSLSTDLKTHLGQYIKNADIRFFTLFDF